MSTRMPKQVLSRDRKKLIRRLKKLAKRVGAEFVVNPEKIKGR